MASPGSLTHWLCGHGVSTGISRLGPRGFELCERRRVPPTCSAAGFSQHRTWSVLAIVGQHGHEEGRRVGPRVSHLDSSLAISRPNVGTLGQ